MIARYNTAIECGIDPYTLNRLTFPQLYWLDYKPQKMSYKEALESARKARKAAADPK